MTLGEFKSEFDKLRNLGWVKSKRRGPTGIGHTLEQMFGLSENNVAVPDLGDIELKARRSNSSSMVTLFTFNRKAWQIDPLAAIKKYGTPDKDGRLGLYFTMTRTPNGSGLFIRLDECFVIIQHESGEILVEWELQSLVERFVAKIPTMILVSAFSEMRGDCEWFKFCRAQILSNTSADIIREQLIEGNVVVDLRLHEKEKSARNHGTAFRVREDRLPLLFSRVEDIL